VPWGGKAPSYARSPRPGMGRAPTRREGTPWRTACSSVGVAPTSPAQLSCGPRHSIVVYATCLEEHPPVEGAEERDRLLGTVCDLIRRGMGHDFSAYKTTTLARRVEKRMQSHRISSLAEYVALLEREPPEAQRLFEELLVG